MNFSQIEEKILKFWKDKKIFEKTLKNREKNKPYVFYDGPPFATGLPHYGHILATAIKDVVLRYWTMRGFYAPRRIGWDCHGLPVENLIEKETGIKNKREIEEKIGIEKFNQLCRASVFRFINEFKKTLERVGRWADYKDAYATLNNSYIESVWWVLKQLWEQGLVYKDFRVAPYCPRCGTPLSNFEVNQGYKEVQDPSIYVKFPIKGEENTFFLVWTTTPWTLLANLVLAVNRKIPYVKIELHGQYLILAKERLEVIDENYQIIDEKIGRDIKDLLPSYKGKSEPIFYQQIFDFFLSPPGKLFSVCYADFVSIEDGTGIVHIAPAYGEEDMNLAKKLGLDKYAIYCVDKQGKFVPEIKPWQGLFVKDADKEIIENLKEKGLLYKSEKIKHNYPFCWRCDSPLLYYALNTWYIRVTSFKGQLLKNNKKIHWVPGYVKEGRFGNWLKEARDWAFSRNRFWGAPIPIWECEKCGEFLCIGSIKEIRELQVTSYKLQDLHRPYIDEITFKCEKCGGLMKRVEEVFDCWFESGSMPYAQWHYPFENKKLVEAAFPADFIAEGLDQTRGWFYTLHVLASALTQKNLGLGKDNPAFKNVVVNGLILDAQGKKLSKKLRNYPEPEQIFSKYGADSLRYFLLASTSIGEDYRFSEEGVRDVSRRVISTFFNTYLFYTTYLTDKKSLPTPLFQRGERGDLKINIKSKNILDKWLVSKLNNFNKETTKWMDEYELAKAARLFDGFIDDLSNWYLRRSRGRFQKPESKKEFEEASTTLRYVLLELSRHFAPFAPFISEEIYQNLKTEDMPKSVHLCDWPKFDKKLIDDKLEDKMTRVREIVNLGLKERARLGIKVRQPLKELSVGDLAGGLELELIHLIKDELNIKGLKHEIYLKEKIRLDETITVELRKEGLFREIVRHIQGLRKEAGLTIKDKISIFFNTDSKLILSVLRNFEKELKKATIATQIKKERKEVQGSKELEIQNKKIWLGIEKE